ncbi:response regulator [Colwellia psychrerythraea]|uniref:Response regulator receiver protein n=1 Tax=Colwellia psychrerythraea TaxID=28229 RepID=A0A099L1J4_COLPS|nr:response regulator [Colwellia psychrerythraea]KGJ96315.1 response regulator receiver protein [Colwellia psychrerythraea]
MNILVVDDKKTVQDMLTDLLISNGHTVDKAINGLDALSKAQQGNYQLFIIDHLMPLMNGLQLTKNLKNNPELANTKIIFMTTQGSQTLKTLAEFPLFDSVIDKPIDKTQLLNLITQFTDEKFDCESLQVNS